MLLPRAAMAACVPLFIGLPTAVPAAEACVGQNCLPPRDNPVEECAGAQCSTQAEPAVPAPECSGQDCAAETGTGGPVEECAGEDCPPVPNKPAAPRPE